MSSEWGPSGAALLRARVPALVLLVLLTAYRSPLTAQKTAFEQLRDSLAGTPDTTALRTMLRTVRRGEPLRAGLAGLRLGQLRADPDFSEAISSFRQAARLEPRRPEAWYGLGLAEAGRSEWEMGQRSWLGSRVGLGALERAASDHLRALGADVGFVPAALGLARIELTLLDTARLAVARDALRRTAAAVMPSPPELTLALGRVERAAGSLDSAAVAFERYILTGGNRPLGLLELARTRLALGQADGDTLYYEGASVNDAQTVAEYRADLAFVAADSILREFDRLVGSNRAAFLHRFWTDRDHLELRPEGERLKEHYRRVLFARVHFPLTISRRFYGRLDAYRSGNIEVDDRGIIYIRQGEPSDRLRPFVFGAMPNESWRYARSGGDLIFHFSAGYDGNGGGDLYDYRLVQSVLDLRGAADAPRDQLILSRQSLSPVYGHMLNWGRFGAAKARVQERGMGAASIQVGTTTDSYELQFSRRLPAVADLIAVGQSPRGSLGHFVFGIAAPAATAHRISGGFQYVLRARVVALDARRQVVASVDTTVVINQPERLTKKEYLVGRVELALPPGRWTYRAALQDGDSAGVVFAPASVRAVGTGRSLGLSDIALGSPGLAVSWITPAAHTVLLSPWALLRKNAEVEIYYELTGATQGKYRHEITVLRADRRQRPMVSLSFDEDLTGGLVGSRRTLRLERLKRGGYIVEVRVTAPDGTFQVRRRSIRLIDP